MYNNTHFDTENKQYSKISGAIVLKRPDCSCLVPVMGVTRLDTHQRSPAVWYQADNAIFGAQHIAQIFNCISPPGWNVQYTKVNGRRGRKHTHTQRHRVHFSWYQEGGGAMVPVTDDHLPSLPNGQLHTYMQKAGDCGDISPQIFLDFPQNFRLRTRNQYCTQAIAWGSTI